jgi:hypothetical protein
MRDFNFSDANTATANIVDVRPIPQELPLSDDMRRDEIEDGATLSSFHRTEEENEASNNTAKIAGAVLVGLLIVGGGIYAYESTLKNTTAPQAVAMKTPAPSTMAAATPDTTAPDTQTATQPASTPSSATAPSVPARQTVRTARDASSDTSTAASTTDMAVNQPMTLTPQTAPPAQQSSPSQTAQIQQPIIAPLGQPAIQPQPEVANNASSDVTLPSGDTTANAPAAAPSDATVQPAAPVQQPVNPTPAPAPAQ